MSFLASLMKVIGITVATVCFIAMFIVIGIFQLILLLLT